jgi:hypothetical protein
MIRRRLAPALPLALAAAAMLLAPPPAAGGDFPSLRDAERTMSVAEVRPGMQGEVWTVFQGTQVEPFEVVVTGVVRNGLGPGKDLIICQLTDPRVQASGAVAGMSGSPLYIDGRLVGALSYQIQRFETVRYAGFTPISDMLEVGLMAPTFLPQPLEGEAVNETAVRRSVSTGPLAVAGVGRLEVQPLTPVFAFSGVSPPVAELFQPHFSALGLHVAALGGSLGTTGTPVDGATTSASPNHRFEPGDAVSVALATGDITLAATGTVSVVEGGRILAFGHPMMTLGQAELPMAEAEIVTILPSQLTSFKVSNTGRVVGTISQDRLSAVYGEIGRVPPMIPVEVTAPGAVSPRTLRYDVVRHPQLTAPVAMVGVAQSVMASNTGGMAQGYRLEADLKFPGLPALTRASVYAGPQGFGQGLNELMQELTAWLSNPLEPAFPERLAFRVEALADHPGATIEQVQLDRRSVTPGETINVHVTWRPYQGATQRLSVPVVIDPVWVGRNLEIVVASGRQLDELAGRPAVIRTGQARTLREVASYVAALRRTDGLHVAVVERASLFFHERTATVDYPGSFERIARGADENRFEKKDAVVPLWETHHLGGRVVNATFRLPLVIQP